MPPRILMMWSQVIRMEEDRRGTGFQRKTKSLVLHAVKIAKWRSHILGERYGFQIDMRVVSIEMASEAMREEVNLKQSKENRRESLTELQRTQTLEVG